MNKTRFDPSVLDPDELDRLAEMVIREEQPALVGREGVRIELPEPIFHLLAGMIRMMREGKAVVVLPEDERLTTQAGADFLGVSRQFFVNLLEKGEVPFHLAGTHRRVYLRDLLKYQQKRDAERKGMLGAMFQELDEAGLYDAPVRGGRKKG